MEWRFIPEERLGGPTAMALDEVAAETIASGGPATVRLYRWTPSTVSLGYGNDADIVDWTYCRDHDIDVTRRQTGGGAIYHDGFGDVAYSIIAPASEFPGDVTECYRQLLGPVLTAFDAIGADVGFAEQHSEDCWKPLCYLRGLDPAHDLVGPDGRKIAGNAQYRTRDAIVQHGSLTFDANPAVHLDCFSDPPLSPSEFADRVCGVRDFLGDSTPDRSTFVDRLADSLIEWADAERGSWTDAERARTETLCREKYDHDRWVRSRNDPVE
jgi:lipoate-protein ligase A